MMKDEFRFFLRTDVRVGADELLKLPEYLVQAKLNKVVILIDGALKKLPYISKAIKLCEKELDCSLFYYDIGEEPTYEYLDEIAEEFRKKKGVQALVGIGGGSTIDFTKGLAVLMTNSGEALKYRGFPENINDPLPVIAVPSTAGTGTETTYNAVFISKKESKKLGINTTKNFPIFSILDPNLIKSCPLHVFASSGMDAMTHALEAFVSPKTQVLSRMLAKEAIRLLSLNLLSVATGDRSLKTLEDLQLGAYLAIIALFNSSAGVAGGLSVPLDEKYGVPHGLSGAVFLPLVHERNFLKGYYDYAFITDVIYGNCKGTKKSKAKKFIDLLYKLNKNLKVPDKLKHFGLNNDEIKEYEANATERARIGGFQLNPVAVTVLDIKSIFAKLK